jgi:hypothetical protein
VGEEKALFVATVDKKWDDSPFKDLEYMSYEKTITVRANVDIKWGEEGKAL